MRLIIGFGGNLGDPATAFAGALDALADEGWVLSTSQLWQTRAVGLLSPTSSTRLPSSIGRVISAPCSHAAANSNLQRDATARRRRGGGRGCSISIFCWPMASSVAVRSSRYPTPASTNGASHSNPRPRSPQSRSIRCSAVQSRNSQRPRDLRWMMVQSEFLMSKMVSYQDRHSRATRTTLMVG